MAVLARADRSHLPENADIASGQRIVLGTAACGAQPCFPCFQCHGVSGEGSAIAHQPRLAGQVYQYLHVSLREFASGNRPQPTMHAVASALTEEQMMNVAAYYSALSPQQLVAEVSIDAGSDPAGELLDQGRNLATVGAISDGVQACGTCHGPSGGGLPPLYPALAGQYPGYLEHQLHAFKAGTRGGDQLKVMHQIASLLSDDQIRAVSQYYGSLQPVRAVPQPPSPAPVARR